MYQIPYQRCEFRKGGGTSNFQTYPDVGVSKNSGKTPQIIHFNRVFHYKPSILGPTPIFGNIHVGSSNCSLNFLELKACLDSKHHFELSLSVFLGNE